MCRRDILFAKYLPWNESAHCFCSSFSYLFALFSGEGPAWWLHHKLLPTNQRRSSSLKSNRRGKQSHNSAREVCSSWLFWASLCCSSRLVSHGWPQCCLERLRRGGRDSVSEFTVAACHRTSSLTYSSKWIRWDCVAAWTKPHCPSTSFLFAKRSLFGTSCWSSALV